MFITLSICAFFIGRNYQQMVDMNNQQQSGFSLNQKAVIPTPSVSIIPLPTTDPAITANWKTYTYSLFSIKVPADWHDTSTHNDFAQLVNYDVSTAPGRDFSPNLDKGKLKVEIYTTNTNQNIAAYLSSQGASSNQIPITVSGQPAIWVNSPTHTYVIYVKHPSQQSIINIAFFLDFDNYRDLAKQILSTFTFTNQKQTPITPTCMPRPACLDATPRCLIAEPPQGCCTNYIQKDNLIQH